MQKNEMDRHKTILNLYLKKKTQKPSCNDFIPSKPEQVGDQVHEKTQPNLMKTSTSASQSRDDRKHVHHESDTSNYSQTAKLKAKNQVRDCKQIKEEELQRYLLEEPALSALNIDFPADQIKQAYIEKLKQTGTAFASTCELIEAIFELGNQNGEHVALTSTEAELNITEQEGFVDRKTFEEIEKLKQEKMCKICLDAQIGIVFVPCGHLVTCVECSENMKTCPLCRAKIQSSIKTFFS